MVVWGRVVWGRVVWGRVVWGRVDAYGGAAGGLMLLYFTNLANFIHVLLHLASHSAWF